MNPDDVFHSPWQFVHRTDKHYFDWLAEDDTQQNAFNTVMTISRMGQVDWFEYYPVEDKLTVDSPSATLLVDIGGGMGHDVAAFHRTFPHLLGKLMFEDITSVVEAGKAKGLPLGIEGISHDFFKPHPEAVRGAKVYYMRTVLHDWPDKQARLIIRNVKDAMTKESILLINENVMPTEDASLLQAEMDLSMMVCFSSLDRTEKQFQELLESEGFQLVKVYKPQGGKPGSGTLLEFVLAK
jgi:hypothetical protein